MAARKTPFYDVGVEQGADMRELFGYWLPWEYHNGRLEEHRGTRQRVSVCDLDYMAECTIEGRDALALVQHLFTRDLSSLEVGAIRYTAMCNADGGMVDDGTIWRRGESTYTYISGDQSDYEWVSEQAQGFDATLTDATQTWTTLALQGPRSAEVLAKLTDAPLQEIDYYRFTLGTVAGIECIIARMGYTGEFGYELHFDARHGERMWRSLMEAGAPEGIVPLGQAGLESLRQEAGYLLVGNEHDRSTNPFEAGIGATVSLGKEAFNGKRALEEIVRRGLTRTLVWLKHHDAAVAATGDTVAIGDKPVGRVTSASYSPTLECGVSMAYVEPQYAILGAVLTIRTAAGDHSATLSTMPLYDPGDVRNREL